MIEFKPESLFNLEGCAYKELFDGVDAVWEVLDRIKDFARGRMKANISELRRDGDFVRENAVIWQGELIRKGLVFKPGDATKGKFQAFRDGRLLEGATVIYAGSAFMDDDIELGPGVVVEPGALLKGPTIIGANTEIRQGAYVRGSCLVGRACVVGHTTEMKNAVLLYGAKAGHFAYIGDSILGRDVNLGAGTKLANLKIVSAPVKIRFGEDVVEVDRRKFGAILGDGVETGCNSVTSPGSILAPGCLVAPNTTVPPRYFKKKSVIRQK